jgi:signal transduction histidine kinase/CheY-like chemotaxis protein/PAS domain-containing protein
MHSRGARYAVALVAVGVALALGLALRAVLVPAPFAQLFLAAVVVSAWVGGFRAGLVVTVVAMVVGELLDPALSVRASGLSAVTQLATFAVAAFLVSSLRGTLHNATERAAASAREARVRERHLAFLAEASSTLGRSLDYDTTLAAVGRLAVPFLADGCVVNLLGDGGRMPVAITHRDPGKERLAREFYQRYPIRSDPQREERPRLFELITDDLRSHFARDAEHLALMQQLDIRSAIRVPLIARGRTLGALSILRTGPSVAYQPGDVNLAADLAARCALAIDNARLYREAQDEIVERRRAEERLRESEERLELALQVGRAGTWDWDVETGQMRVGWPVAEEQGPLTVFTGSYDDFLARVFIDDRPRVIETLAEALVAGGPFEIECRALPARTGLRWTATKGNVFRDATGKAVRVLGVPIDITERKHAEQRLAIQYAATRVMADAPTLEEAALHVLRTICTNLGWVHGGLWRVDRDANVIRCVETWHAPDASVDDFEGASRSATFAPGVGLPGRVWASGEPAWIADVLDDDNFPRGASAARAGLRTALGFPIVRDAEVLGVIEFFHARISPPDATLLAMLTTVGTQFGEFMTRREIEEERVRLLASERAARAEAQQAARRKDEFLAMLGHELRNPLAAIRAAVAVLDRFGPADETPKRQRAIIERQSGKLAQLVNDMLDVSRVVSGKIALKRAPVALHDLVGRCVQSFAAAATNAGQELALSVVEPAVVDVDALRLEQVIANLLDNAIKYTPRGGRIEAVVARDGADAVVRVRDSGMGIAPDLVPRIFDMFAQAERSLDRAQGGLGLGLTLVRQLIEQHGGRVEASSRGLDCGSEFVVRLPVLDVPPVLPLEPAPAVAAEGPSRRVLVIEDNVDGREALRVLLEMMGHHVDVAGDGPEGVDLARRTVPDVAFVDIGLPGLDGYQVAARLRATLGERICMVALTGYGQPDDRARALEAGFDEHLVKPVEAHRLAQLLATLPGAHAA